MSRPIFRHATLGSRGACLLALLVSAFGCSSNNPQISGASVSGVVRYQGKPVTGGIVRLWGDRKDGNHTAQGKIKGDGTYQVLNAPLGTCKVVVNTEAVKRDRSALRKMLPEKEREKLPPEPPGPPVKFMPINRKYSDLKKTDVEITIQKGDQTQDIDLP